MTERNIVQQRVFRFALVGLIGTSLDFLGFSFGLWLGLDPIPSRGIGYFVGTVWAFFLNRTWVFNSNSGLSRVVPFSLTYALSGLVAVAIQALGPNQPEPIGLVLSVYVVSVLVAASINYLSLQRLVFRD